MLTDSSVGAKIILLSKSQNRQKIPPPREHAGIIIIGFVLLKSLFTRCGTAIPTKEIGPANAVTHADNIPDNTTRYILNLRIFTPILLAYASPSRYAAIDFAIRKTQQKQINTINGIKLHEAGFRGAGMTIAIIDGGFMNVDKIPLLKNVKVSV